LSTISLKYFISKKEVRTYLIAFLIALLIHLFIFNILFFINLFKLLILTIFPNTELFNKAEPEPVPDTPPIVLEFDQPKPLLPEKFYELKENPNANEDIPEDTDILSTKSSISAVPNLQQTEEILKPKATEQAEESQELKETRPEEVLDLQGDQSSFAFKNQRTFSKSLLGEFETKQEEVKQESQETETEFLQKEFNAQMIGDYALSTYEWEFAPYMLDFQRKLQRVWTAPPAYSKLGLIYGRTLVYLKINRQGKLVDFRVLQHEGHSSLQQSSVSAIQSVFPFKPLPADFEENFLEIKLLMIYPNLREPLPPQYRR
jgi:outer membrane biosynthesis protein TonB